VRGKRGQRGEGEGVKVGKGEGNRGRGSKGKVIYGEGERGGRERVYVQV